MFRGNETLQEAVSCISVYCAHLHVLSEKNMQNRELREILDVHPDTYTILMLANCALLLAADTAYYATSTVYTHTTFMTVMTRHDHSTIVYLANPNSNLIISNITVPTKPYFDITPCTKTQTKHAAAQYTTTQYITIHLAAQRSAQTHK